jgi:hypothetical protein
MNTPPEASTEYSRADMPNSRGFLTRGRVSGGIGSGLFRRSRRQLPPASATVALAGAVLLVAAEFTGLYHLHLINSNTAVSWTSTGAHNSYALIPIAALAALLALTAGRPPRPVALAAIATLGIVALLIALVGDLPDTHAHGMTRSYVLAATTPGPGLYLETLGAVVLMLSGGSGLLSVLMTAGRERGGWRKALVGPAQRTRSES